jgi:hypothetical protein
MVEKEKHIITGLKTTAFLIQLDIFHQKFHIHDIAGRVFASGVTFPGLPTKIPQKFSEFSGRFLDC